MRMNESCVLVVDDEPDLCEVLASVLRIMNCRVLTAPDGEAALRLMREHRVDLVLTDISMPRRDGLAFVEEARRLQTLARFIFISGYAGKRNVDKAQQLGADRFIEKPFSFEDIEEAVTHALQSIFPAPIDGNEV